MLTLIICLCIVFNGLGAGQSYVNVELDDYLPTSCVKNHTCYIKNLPTSTNQMKLVLNGFRFLKFLYVDDLIADRIAINIESNLQYIRTLSSKSKNSTWLRKTGQFLDEFERFDSAEFDLSKPTSFFPYQEKYTFDDCVRMSLEKSINLHEIDCRMQTNYYKVFQNLAVNIQNLKSSYRNLKVLDLSNIRIEDFDNFPLVLADQMLIVRLHRTKITFLRKNFLNIFTNVRILVLPDTLFGLKVTDLFKDLKKLRFLVTGITNYWRHGNDIFLERFDQKKKCFTLVSMMDETVHENGCLSDNETSIDYDRIPSQSNLQCAPKCQEIIIHLD